MYFFFFFAVSPPSFRLTFNPTVTCPSLASSPNSSGGSPSLSRSTCVAAGGLAWTLLVGVILVFHLLRGGRQALDEAALVRVLTEPKNSLTAQYKALFNMDKVLFSFPFLFFFYFLPGGAARDGRWL